jgi:lysophospholipase L1-like esterase
MGTKTTLAVAVLALAVGAMVDRYSPELRARLSGDLEAPWQTPEYKYRLSLFEEFKPTGGLVVVGDSHVELGPWSDMLPGVSVYNRGISRDTTIGVLRRLPQILAMKPAVVVLMIGVNDIRTLNPAVADVAARYKQIVDAFSGTSHVIALSTLLTAEEDAATVNPKVLTLDKAVALMCTGSCTYVDLNGTLTSAGRLRAEVTPDGLHLNALGYRIIADALRPLVSG